MKNKYWGDIDGFIAVSLLGIWVVSQSFSIKSVLIFIAFSYFLSTFLVRFFSFEKDYYEVFFPTRVFKRKIKVFYSEIEKVKYIIGGFGGNVMGIIKKEMHGTVTFKFKYIIPLTSKKAKPLMKFLKSKGIKIKIYSDYSIEEYNEFLDPEDREKKVKYYR